MEYLEGVDLGTLDVWLKKREERFSPRMAVQIVGGVAAALEAAYTHVPLQGGEPLRLVHRDIKPSNIMVTSEGEIKLLDFGTARANFETREAHTEALHFGSQAYMAPERFMGDPDTPSCDIFALGITLFELLSGQPGGRIQLREERFEAQLTENISKLSLSTVEPEELSELERVLRSMMAFRGEGRLAAAEVEDVMEGLAEALPGLTLRRFSKLHVRDILKDLILDEPPGDSLVGRTLVEDRSAAIDAEGLADLADLGVELKPGEGGAETSAGWLVGADDSSDEICEPSDRTDELAFIDEAPLCTSETVPGKSSVGEAGVGVVAASTDVAPEIAGIMDPEATTAAAPPLRDTGTIEFEKGGLYEEDEPEPSPRRMGVWLGLGLGLLLSGLYGVSLFTGGDPVAEDLGGEPAPQAAVTEKPEPLVQANLEENQEQAAPEVVLDEASPEEAVGSVDVSPEPGVKQKPGPEVPAETKAPEPAVERPAPAPSPPTSMVGGLILSTLSVGGAEVKLTNKDGYLRICREPCIRLEASELASGLYQTRVVPKGGGRGIYLSVRVKPGQVCRYNLKGQGEDMGWEERGCE